MDLTNNSSPSKMFSILNILFLTFLAGQVLYLSIGLFLVQSGAKEELSQLNNIFLFAVPIIDLFIIFTSKSIYTKNVTNFDKNLPLENKILSYQTNSIIQLALLEGANIINVSVLTITANYFFAALFVIIISLFLLNKPTKEKFIIQYELNSEDVVKILG